MAGVTHYLVLREMGLARGPKYARCINTVETLLDEEAAKPLYNQPCEFSGEPRSTYLMDFSPNKSRVASTHGDHTVRVTEIQTGRCTHILTGHPRTPWCLAFHPSSDDILASGCLGGEVRIWDLLGGGSEVLQMSSINTVITSLSFHPSEHILVFSTVNKVYFWDWHKAEPFAHAETKTAQERVRWVRFDQFGDFLYTGINNLVPLNEDMDAGYVVNTHEDGSSDDNPDTEAERHTQEINRLRYRTLLRRFLNFQQSRRSNDSSYDYPPSHGARSPVHEDSLNSARQYAAEVTRSVVGRGRGRGYPQSSLLDSLSDEQRSGLQPRRPGSAFDSVGASSADASPGDSASVRRTIRLDTPGPTPQRRWGRYQPSFFSQSRRSNMTEDSSSSRSSRFSFNLGRSGQPSWGHPSARNSQTVSDRGSELSNSSVEGLWSDSHASLSLDRGDTPSPPPSPRADPGEHTSLRFSTLSRYLLSRRSEEPTPLQPNTRRPRLNWRDVGNVQLPTPDMSAQGVSAVQSTTTGRPHVTVSTFPREYEVAPSGLSSQWYARPRHPGRSHMTYEVTPSGLSLQQNVDTGPSVFNSHRHHTTSFRSFFNPQRYADAELSRGPGTVLEVSRDGAGAGSSEVESSSLRGVGGASSSESQLEVNEFEILPVHRTRETEGSSEAVPTSRPTSTFHSQFRRLMDRFHQRANGAAASGESSHQDTNSTSRASSATQPLPTDTVNPWVPTSRSVGLGRGASTSASSGLRVYSDIQNMLRRNETLLRDSSGLASESAREEQDGREGNRLNVSWWDNASLGWQPVRRAGNEESDRSTRQSLQLPFLRSFSPVLRGGVERFPHYSVTDNTSQTFGAMSLPQSFDQGTDVMDVNCVITEEAEGERFLSDVQDFRMTSQDSNNSEETEMWAAADTPQSLENLCTFSTVPSSAEKPESLENSHTFSTPSLFPSSLSSLMPSSSTPSLVSSSVSSLTSSSHENEKAAPRSSSSLSVFMGYSAPQTVTPQCLNSRLSDVHSSTWIPTLSSQQHLGPAAATVLSSASPQTPHPSVNLSHKEIEADVETLPHPAASSSTEQNPHVVPSAISSAKPSCGVSSQSYPSSTSTSPAFVMSVTSAACLLLSLNRPGHPHFSTPSTEVSTVAASLGSMPGAAASQGSTPGVASRFAEGSGTRSSTYRDCQLSVPIRDLPSSCRQYNRCDPLALPGATTSCPGATATCPSSDGSACLSCSHTTPLNCNQQALHSSSSSRVTLQPTSSSSLEAESVPGNKRRASSEGVPGSKRRGSSEAVPGSKRRASTEGRSEAAGERSSSRGNTNCPEDFEEDPIHQPDPSSRERETMRDMQSRLQRAVQQLQVVNDSVRRLTTSSQAQPEGLSDDVAGYLEQRVSELDQRISNLEQSYNARLRKFQRSMLSHFHRMRERRAPSHLRSGLSRFRHRAGRGDDSERPSRFRPRLGSSQHRGEESEGATTSSRALNTIRGRLRLRRNLELDWDSPPSGPRNQQLLQALRQRFSQRSRASATKTSQQTSTSTSTAPGPSATAATSSTRTTQHEATQQGSVSSAFGRSEEPEEAVGRGWQGLRHVHLHPDYSHSILDDTVNRPQWLSHNLMNQTIAQTFWNREEFAVASNIIPDTHRIQRWDLRQCLVPDISDAQANVVVSHCKLHNEASCSVSQDGSLLATIVPGLRGFPDNNIMAVFSLRPDSLGQCLYTKKFGPNAISVSLSPKNNFIMVGLASRRMFYFVPRTMMVAQVYRLVKQKAGEQSMEHVTDVFHPNRDLPSHISTNSGRFLPGIGEGLVYGTNKGDLHFCRPGPRKIQETDWSVKTSPTHRRHDRMPRRRRQPLVRTNISTQTTTCSIRCTVSTQTQGQENAQGQAEPQDDAHSQQEEDSS